MLNETGRDLNRAASVAPEKSFNVDQWGKRISPMPKTALSPPYRRGAVPSSGLLKMPSAIR